MHTVYHSIYSLCLSKTLCTFQKGSFFPQSVCPIVFLTYICTYTHTWVACVDVACQCEGPCLSQGDGLVKGSLLFGGKLLYLQIAASSPHGGAKHARVCLLISHKRGDCSLTLIHKQRQTFRLLCRPSHSSFFSPSSLEGHPRTLTPEQAWRYSDHTQSLQIGRASCRERV